jgi:hypothetical protein
MTALFWAAVVAMVGVAVYCAGGVLVVLLELPLQPATIAIPRASSMTQRENIAESGLAFSLNDTN